MCNQFKNYKGPLSFENLCQEHHFSCGHYTNRKCRFWRRLNFVLMIHNHDQSRKDVRLHCESAVSEHTIVTVLKHFWHFWKCSCSKGSLWWWHSVKKVASKMSNNKGAALQSDNAKTLCPCFTTRVISILIQESGFWNKWSAMRPVCAPQVHTLWFSRAISYFSSLPINVQPVQQLQKSTLFGKSLIFILANKCATISKTTKEHFFWEISHYCFKTYLAFFKLQLQQGFSLMMPLPAVWTNVAKYGLGRC